MKDKLDKPGQHLPQPPSRRALLGGSVTLTGGYLVAGCEQSPPGPSGTQNPSTGDGSKEAPMLASLVESGELPPVEERLPENPLVVEPLERIGTYGGTWETAVTGRGSSYWINYLVSYDHPMRWDPESFESIPNLAESVDVSEDGREFTIALRNGVKWSDGEPFTTDDVVFAFEDVHLNEELRPVVSSTLVSPGSNEVATLEKIDDQTVRIVFAEPNGFFLTKLGQGGGGLLTDYPRHYLEQFHPKYNPNVADDAAAEGYDGWAELFAAKAGLLENVDLPVLNAWIITTPLGESGRVTAERNPYYWEVDSEGNQLPYIDEVVFEVITDQEVILLNASNGEYTFHYPFISGAVNRPVLAQNAEAGRYRLFGLNSTRMNHMVISLNLTHQDPVKREIFSNKEFRIGLSHAINREELVDAAYQRQGEPWQAAPRPESEFFDEEFAKQYIEYDVDLANEHLDRAGYTQRDSEGVRLGPDGAPISFSIDVIAGGDLVDPLDLVQSYWRDVGVDMRANAIERTLLYTRKDANEHDGAVWAGGGGYTDAIVNPRFYFPAGYQSNPSFFAIAWAQWFVSRGEQGEEPPERPRRQMELYWELMEQPSMEQRRNLFREILRIAKEEFYVIGIALEEGLAGVKKDNLHNAEDPMILDFTRHVPGPYRTEQFFIEP